MTELEAFEVFYNAEKILVQVCVNPRAKKMRLKVEAKKRRTLLVLPKKSLLKAGKVFAQNKAEWIFNEFSKLPEQRTFSDSQSISFIGQEVVLKHSSSKRGVWLEENIVWVCGEEAHFARRVRDFFKKKFKEYASQKALEIALSLEVNVRKITIKEIFSRWGSCTQDGHIALSWRLSLAPLYVMDYVISHEVAHLKEMNHSSDFWQIVSSCCPEYKKAELWLKKNVSYLHSFDV